MSKPKTEAGKWLRSQGHVWSGKRSKAGSSSQTSARHKRVLKGRVTDDDVSRSVRSFVNLHANCKTHGCVFVPGAQRDVPARLKWLGKSISAARYMATITLGAPKHDGQVVRHLCGNGHLSCVNPNHLAWGDHGDNAADAAKHRHAGSSAESRIRAVTKDRP